MNWHLYLYLVGMLVACALLLLILCQLMPELLRPSRRRRAAELSMLACIVLIALLTIYLKFYSGQLSFAYLDVGNDTSEQYLPYYYNMLDSIRGGTLGLWNHEYGLGTSPMSYQSWTLDPFNLVFVPLGILLGNARVALALVMVQSLKAIIVAFLFDHLLTFYCKTPISRILGSALCAFSGYLMLWGQHYWLGTVFVMATALPLLLELLMERETPLRFLALALGVAMTIVSSVYSGFMVMLFATGYAALRVAYVSDDGLRGFLRLFGRLAVPVVCGILLSAVAVVPYATLLLGESTRVVSSDGGSTTSRVLSFLCAFVPLKWLPMILSRVMGNGLVSCGDPIPPELVPTIEGFSYVNVYEFITLGLSAAAFLLLSQFFVWVVRSEDRRMKAVVAISTALIVLYCVNFFLPALSNALVGPKYRSSFSVVIPACIAMAVGFDRIVVPGRVERRSLCVASLLSIAVVLWSLRHVIDGRLDCLWYLLAVAACSLLLFLLGNRDSDAPQLSHLGEGDAQPSPSRPVFLALCCALIISSSVVDGFLTTNNRDICSSSNLPGLQSSGKEGDTVLALEWLRETDPTFWRAEKLYSNWTWLNDSLIEHYSGVSSYNSTLDGDIEEFFCQFWPEAIGGDIAYQVFVNDPDEPELLGMLGVKYLLSLDDLDWNWCQEVAEFGSVKVYRNLRAGSILSLRSGVITEGELAEFNMLGRRQLLGALVVVPDDRGDVLLDDPSAEIGHEDLSQLDLGWMDLNDWQMGEDGLPAAVPASQARISRDGGSSLSGMMFANVNSIACLAVPHVAGWTVLVDGVPVDTFRANYGFIGFEVPAGVHSFEAQYSVPHLRLGATLSTLGLACTVLLALWVGRTRRSS